MREIKDSGIVWIGTIPAHWELQKVKNAFYRSKEEAHIEDPIVLSLARSGVKVRDISTNEGQLAESYYNYNPVVPGDLLLNPMDLQSGANCSISKVAGVISPAYINLRTIGNYSPVYYDYYFKTQYWAKAFFAHGKGVSFDNRWTLSPNDLFNYAIPVPPYSEQQQIAAFLDKKCGEIDTVVAKTRDTIDEYKKLRQAIVTDAITKGIRLKRTLKSSKNIWYGDIPADWDIRKLKYMFRIKKEIAGKEGYTVLSITQRGVCPKNIASNEGQLAENYSNYQLVEPGDFAMNHMDLLTGWVDISQYSGVTSPDYRVFNLLDPQNNCSKYYLYLMQMCYTNRIFYGLGQGVSGMGRWRLQADKFLNFTIPVPSYEEQTEIADYLDRKCAEIDALVAKKTALLEELELYKRSVIYEYVTGKKEVGAAEQAVTTIVYPYFPAVLGTNKTRFAQAVLMSRILDKCRTKMGRVKLEKMLYTIETSIGFDFDTEYVRQAAGPLDESIYDCEAIISRRNKWYTMKTSKYGVSYTPTKDSSQYKKYYDKYFADYDSEIERIIGIFMDYDADQAEIVATLFAAWNDFVIDRKEFTDEQLVDEVLNNWNDSKKRFSKAVWLRAIEQMRQNNIVPKGYGKRTVIKN